MLMDDTIILAATSRERCVAKLQILFQFCNSSGMVINETKTKFMAVNSDAGDKLR